MDEPRPSHRRQRREPPTNGNLLQDPPPRHQGGDMRNRQQRDFRQPSDRPHQSSRRYRNAEGSPGLSHTSATTSSKGSSAEENHRMYGDRHRPPRNHQPVGAQNDMRHQARQQGQQYQSPGHYYQNQGQRPQLPGQHSQNRGPDASLVSQAPTRPAPARSPASQQLAQAAIPSGEISQLQSTVPPRLETPPAPEVVSLARAFWP